MSNGEWHDVGPAEAFQKQPVTEVEVRGETIAISYSDGTFGAISGSCNHVGGPLGQGRLKGDYVVCPWHNWKFHRTKGTGEPGFEEDAVPSYELRVEHGRLLLRTEPLTRRQHKSHAPHPLARAVVRDPGPVRVAGISTTNMDRANPRYSTSEALLEVALQHAEETLGCPTRLLRLNELTFRPCEGYYSKSAQACIWPCSITQMDPRDQMQQVYEALVFWADVILVATPIRWGNASALYYKMVERMNCVQNQMTIADNMLIRNKVASFIITGGQDNIQAVAGQMLGFFSELGFCFPPFAYIAHSRGWSAEDMERNVEYVRESDELREGARELVRRAVDLSKVLLEHQAAVDRVARGGRKAHHCAS